MIHDTLAKLGLGPKEIEVFLTVAKHGKVLPAQVAKLTRLNRSTVYSVAKELIARGILTEDLGAPNRYLVALPPEDLQTLIVREQQRLHEKKQLVDQAIGELAAFSAQATYQIPKIVFIAEEQIEFHLRKRSRAWNDSIMKRDQTWWGFQDATFVARYRAWIEKYWQVSAPTGLSLKLLSESAPSERETQRRTPVRREVRIWNQANTFTSTLWVCGDFVILISTRAHPFSLVEIEDAALAHNVRQLFRGIWDQAKPMKGSVGVRPKKHAKGE